MPEQENTPLPFGVNEKQVRLLWIYLPIFVMLAMGVVIYKLGQQNAVLTERLMDLQERRLTEKNELIKQKDELVKQWQDGYFRLYNVKRYGKNDNTNDSL